MDKTKIISISFLAVALLLGYFLFNSIEGSITEAERIAKGEQQIIEKLEMIREAQIAYQAVNGKYTSNWDALKSFVDSGQFYITSKIEHIITLDYGADSIYIEIDTLGTRLVKDSVFTAEKFPNFELATLDMVPTSTEGAKFAMWADKIDKSGVTVDVVEVWNTEPVNPERKPDNESRTKQPLRFGSRTSITTAGNWE